MKKALLALAVVAAASSSYAQGIITFYNSSIPREGRTLSSPAVATGDGTVYQAGIFRPDGTTGAGDGYTAGLFLASDLNTPLATTTFRINNNFQIFATSQDVTVQGVPVGQPGNFVVRAWETAAGSFANSTIRGEAAFTSGALGGPIAGSPPAPNATMSGFMGFVMVIPEPSSLALGAIGIGAMMLRRRK